MVEIAGRHVLCVGGGAVAARKLGTLLEAGAEATVIAPALSPDLEGRVAWIPRAWEAGDVAAADPPPWLALAATGVAHVDAAVAAEAEARATWCLRAAGPGSAALPAVVRDGALTVAVSTGVPALSRAARDRVQDTLGGWGALADLLADLRADPEVRAALAALPPADRSHRWQACVTALTSGAAPVADRELARRLLRTPQDPAFTDVAG